MPHKIIYSRHHSPWFFGFSLIIGLILGFVLAPTIFRPSENSITSKVMGISEHLTQLESKYQEPQYLPCPNGWQTADSKNKENVDNWYTIDKRTTPQVVPAGEIEIVTRHPHIHDGSGVESVDYKLTSCFQQNIDTRDDTGKIKIENRNAKLINSGGEPAQTLNLSAILVSLMLILGGIWILLIKLLAKLND